MTWAPAATSSVDLANALVGLPVAVVIVTLGLYAWRQISQGEMITGREHRETVAQMEHRIAQAEAARESAIEEARYWQSVALRALNVSEAAIGRGVGR